MLDRIACGSFPRKHHIAHRDPAGNLRWEECLTQKGFDGPYTIFYHERRPHEHRVAEAKHGFAVPEAAQPAPHLAKRHYKSLDLKASGGAPIDARTLPRSNAPTQAPAEGRLIAARAPTTTATSDTNWGTVRFI